MQKRILGLDIVRAAAIIMVVIGHSYNLIFPFTKAPYGIGTVVSKVIATSTFFSKLGVELFFVLSGFLIGNILIKEFKKGEPFTLKSLKVFWVRRWFRTLPNYYLILLVNTLLYSWRFHTNMFHWPHFLLVQNLFSRPPSFFGEAWSLAIEEWFYLTMPLAILVADFIFKKSPRKKILLATICSYIAVSTLLKIVYALFHFQQPDVEDYLLSQDNGLRKIIPLRLDAIGFGVLMAYFKNYYADSLFQLRKKLFAIGCAGIGIVAFFQYWNLYQDMYQHHWVRLLTSSTMFSLIPIFFSFMLPFAESITTIGSRGLAKTIVYISTISYSLYLVHLTLLYDSFFKHLSPPNLVIALRNGCLYLVVLVGVASLLYFLYEKPMTALRDKLKQGMDKSNGFIN